MVPLSEDIQVGDQAPTIHVDRHWAGCNGHYNRTPDLGKCVMWWNAWDLARHVILDVKELDRNVTWLTKHKDTS